MYSGWNQTVTLRHLQEIMCKADHKVNDVFKQLLTDIVNPVSRGQFGNGQLTAYSKESKSVTSFNKLTFFHADVNQSEVEDSFQLASEWIKSV